MQKRTTFSYVYFLSRAFFIGYGFSLLFNLTNKDSWMSFLIGQLISFLVIFLIVKIKGNYQQREVLKEPGHFLLKGLYFLFSLFVATEILFIFQTLASNFFLIESPNYFIIFPTVFLIYRICKNSWTTIGRVGSILMVLSLSMTLILLCTLTSYLSFDNFLPILTTPTTNILQSALYYAAYTTAPLLYLILIPKTNQSLPTYHLISSFTVILMGVFIIGILGPNLIRIYRYPEYMVLKGIKILDFIEKVENIFTMGTLFDLFMVLAISMNVAKERLPKKFQPVTFGFLLFLIFAASLFLGKHYDIALQIYYYLPIILWIFLILILGAFLFTFKKGKK